MGVNIRDLVKDSGKVITIENLREKTIAIDAWNWLYQFLAIIRGPDGKPMSDREGNVTSHLIGLFYRNLNFLEMDLKPVYVFDGEPSKLKLETIKKRKEVKQEAREKMEEARKAGDLEEAKKAAMATSRLTPDMVEDAKELLQAFGIPVVQAPSEGEAQAAYMTSKGDVWATASQDYDAFLFNAERLIRNLNISQTRRVGSTTKSLEIEWYSLSKVLEDLAMTREQLIDVGILIGTDFHDGIPGVGPKTALQLIQEHGSLKKILDQDIVVKKKKITDFLDQSTYQAVLDIFLSPNVTDGYKSALKWEKPNLKTIREILVDVHDFDPQRVDSNLNKLRKKIKSGKQKTIDSFFKK